jgi:hypothetical protein
MMGTTSLQNSAIFAFNAINTTAAPLVGANASVATRTFHNPGTIDVVVFPTTVLSGTPGGGSVALAPTTSALGGGFRIFANGGQIILSGAAARQAWQALSVSGSGNPLTVMEEYSR